MTKQEIKTKLQGLITKKLPRGVPEEVLYAGLPPKNDSDQLKLRAELRLTITDLDELATDISKTFGIHFPMEDAEGASTLGDLVTAIAKKLSESQSKKAGPRKSPPKVGEK
jgi:acyl carrier protein